MPRISPEKSSFAQTCNLLSHYLKEKGTLRDLSLGINGESDSTFSDKTQSTTKININPMNLFSQHASMQLDDDDAISITSSRFSEQAESEAKSGQMTIFYGGQVMVLDDICHGKAKQVMQLASKFGFVIPSSTKYHAHYSMCSASRGNDDIKQQQQWQPIASDLPIARRASLHRFLSKRKDRASARGPYHLHNNNNNNNKYPSPKEHFDLNL